MSTLDPVPNIDELSNSSAKTKSEVEEQQKGASSTMTLPIAKAAYPQLKLFFFETLGPILIIVQVTIIFMIALLADKIIIITINWTFGSTVNQNQFASTLLEGIQLLSALGTAIAYILYLIRSLFQDARHVLKEIRTGDS